ncbi:uncharacterized protein [Amphiura filiformis]|uniref:uncharacterized protein n=1 Tax=Amphiura filiformis TaxID=82378 RepID=UPI003B226B10
MYYRLFFAECKDIQVVGWNTSVNRYSYDALGWTFVLPGKRIPCDGVIYEWSYQAMASQPFRAIVWRPTLLPNEFIVVGINDIPAIGVINEAVSYAVSADERIGVRKGDVIGLAWNTVTNPLITFNLGGDASETRWYYDADPVHLQPGDTVTTVGVQDREYSFAASLTRQIQSSEQACIPPKPFGFESGAISDDQLSASSYNGGNTIASKARLNGDSHWRAGSADNNTWYQVDFVSVVTITTIVTQGSGNQLGKWISALQVQFGNSTSSLMYIMETDGDIMASIVT